VTSAASPANSVDCSAIGPIYHTCPAASAASAERLATVQVHG
jgi:hypothetical protein